MAATLRSSTWTMRAALVAVSVLVISKVPADARPARPAPPLGPPSGTIVNVATEAQLQAAVSHLASNTTVVIAPGTYLLSQTLYINGTFTDVTVRGGTDNADNVVLVGPGMSQVNYGAVPFGIWTGGSVQRVTIANLTIRDIYYHPIIFNAGTQNPRVYNVHLINAGEQFIKSNPDGAGGGVNNGVVDYSVIEYTTTARGSYTNGVDVITGTNWTIRHNLFRNITARAGDGLAGPAILIWKQSSGTVTEGNLFLNCARGIAYGLEDAAGFDHQGGMIRNNVFFRSASQPGDVGITINDSPQTEVLNNTVFVSGTWSTPIEYRFPGTTGVRLVNNLLDGSIGRRDGALGTEQSNVAGANAGMFVDPLLGDLHLSAVASGAIDRGVVVAGVIDDWDGQPRPQGATYDVGADERSIVTASYQISGRVADAGTGGPVSGVTMKLTGAQQQTTTTGIGGDYVFSGLGGPADYTVTPLLDGYVFVPVSQSFALSGNQTADFVSFADAANQPPMVSITAPSPGATFSRSAGVDIEAAASDADGRIVSVSFYAGDRLLAVVNTAPYRTKWRNPTLGSPLLTAVAADDHGALTQSEAVTIVVVKK